MAAPLKRIRTQRCMKTLKQCQDDIRFSIRQANEREYQSSNLGAEKTQDPHEVWTAKPVLYLLGQPIASLPKKRDFWVNVDFSKLSLLQLRAAIELLDMETSGKKMDLIARLQDWVNLPQIEIQRKKLQHENLKAEQIEASGSVFSFGNNSIGQLGLGNREAKHLPTEILTLKGKKIIKVFTVCTI
jgi:Regulator of chromosome condensation (RCC1) repeat